MFLTNEGHVAYLAFATDEILFALITHLLFDLLCATFEMSFSFTTTTGNLLQFLNYRIIQSEHGTSVDQYNHIRQSILRGFFPDDTPIPFQSSPFPLSPAIEMVLFQGALLIEKENEAIAIKYNGSYIHWTGVLLHIGEKSRQDMPYVAMRLSGYNNYPSLETYKILHQSMCYLYHHPHVPIMFSRKHPNMETPIKSYFWEK